MKEIKTYQDLYSVLASMTAEQLAQPIQIADSPCDDSPVELQQGIAIGTVAEFQFSGARSVVDNKYHADEVVILIDGSPFSKDGATSYQWLGSGLGDDGWEPVYGKDGPTKREDQLAPPEIPSHVMETVRCRLRQFGN